MTFIDLKMIDPPQTTIHHFQTPYLSDAILKYLNDDLIGAKKDLNYIKKSNQYNIEVEIDFLFGLIEYQMGNYTNSIKYFTNFVGNKISSYRVGFGYFYRGLGYLRLEKFNKSKADLLKSLNYFPPQETNIPYIHFYIGMVESCLENYDLAILEFNIAQSALNREPIVLKWRAYNFLKLGQKESACEDIKLAIKLGSDDLLEYFLKWCK